MTWKARKYNQPFRNIPEKIIQYITTIIKAINTYPQFKFEHVLLPETTSFFLTTKKERKKERRCHHVKF